MQGFSKVVAMGNMTRDPEMRNFQAGGGCASFTVAINRKFKTAGGEEREKCTFLDCTAFGKSAEFITKYFSKGRGIIVEGTLRMETWEDKATGQPRSKIGLIVDRAHFCGGPRNDGREDNGDGGEATPRRQENAGSYSGGGGGGGGGGARQRTGRPAASHNPAPAYDYPPGDGGADVPF